MTSGKKIIKTVVTVLIRKKRLLMEFRKKSKKVYPGLFMCPSGHVESKESLKNALKREMLEELGINVNNAEFYCKLSDIDSFSGKNFQHNFFIIKSFSGKIKKSNEALKVLWKSLAELKKQELAPIVEKIVKRLEKDKLL